MADSTPEQPKPNADAEQTPAVVEEKPSADTVDKQPSVDEPRHVIVDNVRHVEPRHGFISRWLRRLAAAITLLLIVLLIGFVAISVALQSSLPRSIAQEIATGLVGHDVSLGNLDIGWGGGVTITDLVVRLPGEAEAEGDKVIEVPTIYAELDPLPLLALKVLTGGSPLPSLVRVESPTVYMTQSDAGDWTLLQSLDLLASAGGSSSSPDTGPSAISLPPLPDIELIDGTVIVRNNAGDEERLTGLVIEAGDTSPLIYRAKIDAPDVAEIRASLTPHNGRTQEARIVVTDGLRKLAEPFVSLPEFAGNVGWTGAFTSDGGIDGVLSFNKGTTAVGVEALGDLTVNLLDGIITVEPAATKGKSPQRLRLENVPGVDGPVQVVAGKIQLTPDAASIEGLLLDLLGGNVLVEDIVVGLESETLSAVVGFQNLQPAGGIKLTGSLTGDLWYGRFGEPRGSLVLETSGEAAGRTFENASARVEVYGYDFHDFTTLDIELGLPEGVLAKGGPETDDLPIPAIRSKIEVRLDADRKSVDDPHIRLAKLETVDGSGSLSAEGIFYLPQPDSEVESKRAANYGLWVDASDWPVQVPRIDVPLPLGFGAVFKGQVADNELRPVEIGSIYARYGDINVYGGGWYIVDPKPNDAGEPSPPLSLDITLVRREGDGFDPPPDYELAENKFAVDPGAPGNQGDPANDDSIQFSGDLTSYLTIWGDPLASDLRAEGRLDAQGFAFGPYELGDLATGFVANVTPDRLTFETTDADLFGSQMAVSADVPYDVTLPGVVTVDIDDLSVGRLCEAIALEVGGEPATGNIDLTLEATLSGFDANRIKAASSITVTDLATAFGPVADTITLDPAYLEGRVLLPIRVVRAMPEGLVDPVTDADPFFQPDVAEGVEMETADRSISLTLEYDLNAPPKLTVRNLLADGYPLTPAPDLLGDTYAAAATLRLKSQELVIYLEEEAVDENVEGPQFNSPIRFAGELDAGLKGFVGPNLFDLEPILDAKLDILGLGETIEIREIRGQLPNIGHIRGGGSLLLGDLPGRSNVWVRGTALLEPLAQRMQLPEGAEGEVNFALNVRPAPGARPKGDILFDAAFSGESARWRSVDIDRGQVVAYFSRADRPDGSAPRSEYDFTVASTERARLFVAGGSFDGYLKYRDRRALNEDGTLGGDQFGQASFTGINFDLGQLGPLLERDKLEGVMSFNGNVFGPLSLAAGGRGAALGEESLTGSLAAASAFNGNIDVKIREARLGTIDVFRVILEAAKLIQLPARDEVDLSARIDNGTAFISGLRAYVDGVEIRGNATIRDVFGAGPQPLSGTVIVLAKPLDAFGLPFLSGAQEILDAIQSQASALQLSGTVESPRAAPAVLGEFGETLGALLGR